MKHDMTQDNNRAAPDLPSWLVWIVALGFVFVGLGSSGILDNNEGLYAEIPREMLAAGDWRAWVIPHLNGLPYMEKPPLLYWLTAFSFLLFGESEWSARLVPALSALGCVGLLLWFGRACEKPRTGKLAALMFISGLGVMAMSHVLMFDMLLTVLLTAALMLAWRHAETGRPALLRGSYACLALALLAKGLVALILYGLVVAGWTLFARRPQEGLAQAIRRWFDGPAILLFAAIAVPWHLLASLVEPIFAWFYFVNEHLLRFLGRREPHDYYSGPWWYYLPRMAIYLFPWSFMPFALLGAQRSAEGADARVRRMLLLAWLMPLLFFSVSSAKANYYLVAVMPFAAFHLALALEGRQLRTMNRALPGLLIALLALLLCIAAALRHDDPARALVILGMPQRQFLLLLIGGSGVLALLAALVARFGRAGLLPYLALPAWLAAGLLLVLQAMQPLVSTERMAGFIRQELPGRQVYLYRNFEQQSSLPFYLKAPLPVVDMRSNDLFWGDRLREGNRIALSIAQFRAEAQTGPAAIVVMRNELPDFRAAGLEQMFANRKTIGTTTVFFN
jgi:4-amino-4-deoxy-L-arabinose transferase-like glycosyltransferase